MCQFTAGVAVVHVGAVALVTVGARRVFAVGDLDQLSHECVGRRQRRTLLQHCWLPKETTAQSLPNKSVKNLESPRAKKMYTEKSKVMLF